jgi:hypothetical protein
MGVIPELLSPCGLYCGVCHIYQATQAGDMELLARLAHIYADRLPGLEGLTAQDTLCDGCLSERRFKFCRGCAIKDCAHSRGYEGCHECETFPCAKINEFPSPSGRQVMLRSIPYRREHGTVLWVQAEEERYRCPQCGTKLYRGASVCVHCHAELKLG